MKSRLSLVTLAVCLVAALFCLLYPIFVIRPFRAQGPAELDAALFVLRVRPFVMAGCVALSIAALFWIWRDQLRRATRIATVASVAAICIAAALSAVNMYERMFHRVDAPAFESSTAAKLDSDEKVLAIRAGIEHRAYPVRALAYHHIVNDDLGGVPVAATY